MKKVIFTFVFIVCGFIINAQTNTFPTSGSVGIGVTNPQTTLNVLGDIQVGLNTDPYWFQINANKLIFNRPGTSYIDFVNDSNSLSFRQGSSYNTVMYLSSTGLVGIGTASPAQKLHVSGNVLLDNSKNLRWLDSGGIQRTVLNLDSNNNLNLGTSAGGNLVFHNGSTYTERLRINTNGNVGIGTTNPAAQLSVSDNGKTGLEISSSDSNNWTTIASYDRIESVYKKIRIAANSYDFKVNGTDSSLLINTNGNVGIGTVSPSAKLEVLGASNNASVVLGNENLIGFKRNDGLLVYGIGHTNNEFTIGRTAVLGANAGTPINIATGGTYTRFSHGTNEVMRINSNGNVGIGTTNPNRKLEVDGDIAIGSTSIAYKSLLFKPVPAVSGYNGTLEIESSTTPGSGIAKYLTRFKTTVSGSGQTRHDVAFDGRVGIGTTSPSYDLQVNGGSSFGSGHAYGNLVITEGEVISGYYGTVNLQSNSTPGTGVANFLTHFKTTTKTTGGQTIHNVAFDGNVGIGTTTPDEKFVVQTTDTNRYIKFKAPNGEERLQFYTGGTGNPSQLAMYGSDGTSRNVQISAGGTSFINGGNVGIGTTSPANNLEISDVDNPTLAIGKLNTDTNGSSTLSFYAGGGGAKNGFNVKYNKNTTTDRLSFVDGGNIEVMTLKNGGNVGIGTLSPDAKLAVNGRIHAQEVKIDLIGWPDYVFKKEYDLLSIEEVEAYIKKNGHLPKMPSAKKVEKEGVLLGEMNKKLLEKIEELTLYTIEQEKKIQKQQKKIQKLESLEERMKKLESLISKKEK